MTFLPCRCGRLKSGVRMVDHSKFGSAWSRDEPMYDWDIVALPGNQVATENTNCGLPVGESPAYF